MYAAPTPYGGYGPLAPPNAAAAAVPSLPPPPPPPPHEPDPNKNPQVVMTNSNVSSLTAAEFVTPSWFPSPLCVRPPKVPAHIRRPERRWSEAKFCNPEVPSYLPPELMLFGDGRPLEAFLMRARLEDTRRLMESHVESLYFMRKGGELPEGFRGSPAEALSRLREKKLRDFHEASRCFQQEALANAAAAQDAQQKDRVRLPGGKIQRKIYFTPAQIESQVFGALFGSRGATQKALQAETGCKIILGGRGITDIRKISHLVDLETAKRLAEEDPHVAITAPNETQLRIAVQKVEFLISDDPEAQRLREENKRRGEIDNGVVYRGAGRGGGGGAGSAYHGGRSVGADATAGGKQDEDVENFLKTLDA